MSRVYGAHLTQDDQGSTNFYPSLLKHNKNGQLIAVCGDNEYTIYTSLRQRGLPCYAAKTAASNLKIFKHFKHQSLLLGVTMASEGDIPLGRRTASAASTSTR